MAIISDELARMINNLSPGHQVSQIGTRLQEALAGEFPDGSISTAEIANLAVTNAKVAANAINLAKISAGLMVGIAVEDAKTTSREENIAGLASAIVLANSLKITINLHYADQGVGGEEHIAADTAIASDDATDLASVITLLSEIQDSYVAHDDDSILVGAWVYHQAQGTERALASESNPTTLQLCLAIANDLKAKLNLHMADAVSHSVGDSAAEAGADVAYGAAIIFNVADVESGDIVVWGIIDDGTGNVTGVTAVVGSGTLTLTFSADPQNDAIVNYAVFREST